MTIAVVGLIGFAVLVVGSFALDLRYKADTYFSGCIVSMALTIIGAAALLALLVALGL